MIECLERSRQKGFTQPYLEHPVSYGGRTVLPAYVIHSPSLPDRRAHIERQMTLAGLEFEWVTDFEVDDITQEVDRAYFAPNAPLSIRQKSCAMKHIAAMQRIQQAGHDRALIFEDDAFLVPSFVDHLRNVLDQAEKWPRPHILHLGAATNFYTPADRLRHGQILYEGDRCRNMEAYVIGAREAEARLQYVAKKPMELPIDFVFNNGDPAMGISFVWSEPPLAEQGSLTGAFKSSLSAKQHPQLQLRVQFAIQKFRRRYLKRWTKLLIPTVPNGEQRS